MTDSIQQTIPYLVLISHVLLAILFISLLFRNPLALWVGKNSILLGFLVALGAVAGSLFYSELVGFEPCVLCWWQRVLLYPLAILFGAALWKKKGDVFIYATPLALISLIISLYHQYVYMGGKSLLPCTALGGACAKIYVMAFGYITIPMMSLTVALFILLLAWTHRIYENSHA